MEILDACAKKLGVNLSKEQLELFSVYYTDLVEWNNRFNLTRITGFEDVQIKHFCDSLTTVFALNPEAPGKNLRVIDVGTGAGFPGIPLKIAWPSISLTLLESTGKKTVFLKHIDEKLGLSNVAIVTGRAEEAARLSHYREKFDVVLCRAVAALPVLAELCLPFCAVGGRFIAQKKGDISEETVQAARAIGVMGGLLREVKKINIPELADDRCLVIIDKVKQTPKEYPRRPGTPAKNPIL